MDQGIVENIPVCHVYPMVLCEDVPQLCVPCQISEIIPVSKSTRLFVCLFVYVERSVSWQSICSPVRCVTGRRWEGPGSGTQWPS